MNRILIILGLFIAGTAAAEDTSGQQTTESYISILCSSVQNKPDASADYFRIQIKDVSMQNQSPSAINKTEFDENKADKVIGVWTALSPAEREKIKTRRMPDGAQ